MLISNSNYVKGDIISLKLVNGDEVVAELVERSDTSWVLARPMVVVGGAKGIGLIQAMFSLPATKGIEVSSDHVMMHCETVDQLRDHYIELTTGIKPVSKGSIIV